MLTLTKDEIENSVYRNSDLKKTAINLYAKLEKAEADNRTLLERLERAEAMLWAVLDGLGVCNPAELMANGTPKQANKIARVIALAASKYEKAEAELERLKNAERS